ncbi:hypothetical protein I41_52580 [Lacipirellula limnantheis]|uniref:Uncharacterized protein n=1 Tax=Lacipirellula limnantheis TaxID=2528024 RepID=A0A517U5Y5_9BACT|nr:hypothetical protein I41_52580 [Lacipirellula limnantheis]
MTKSPSKRSRTPGRASYTCLLSSFGMLFVAVGAKICGADIDYADISMLGLLSWGIFAVVHDVPPTSIVWPGWSSITRSSSTTDSKRIEDKEA